MTDENSDDVSTTRRAALQALVLGGAGLVGYGTRDVQAQASGSVGPYDTATIDTLEFVDVGSDPGGANGEMWYNSNA